MRRPDTFDCGHTMDDIVGGVCAGCMAEDDAKHRELEAEVERLRDQNAVLEAANERSVDLELENARLCEALYEIRAGAASGWVAFDARMLPRIIDMTETALSLDASPKENQP